VRLTYVSSDILDNPIEFKSAIPTLSLHRGPRTELAVARVSNHTDLTSERKVCRHIGVTGYRSEPFLIMNGGQHRPTSVHLDRLDQSRAAQKAIGEVEIMYREIYEDSPRLFFIKDPVSPRRPCADPLQFD